MKTLFIDTHTDYISFAIKSDKYIYGEGGQGIHVSDFAINTLEKLLCITGTKMEDLEEIIVVNGPGSFTGVRIGVTIAKTIAYSFNIPIKTITSLEALGVSSEEDFDIITVSDSKGFYSALKKDDMYTDFSYRKKCDFEKYIEENNFKVCTNKRIDVSKVLKYLINKEHTNAHLVNPIYIKEIDALK